MDGSRADGLLERPVVETVAALVDRCLSQAGRAVRKVGRPGNPEALHDFRVALRRCRGVLRAYRPWLGKAAGKRVRSELRRLMRQTNRGRDAEVQIVWLESTRPSLRRSERAGLNYLLERLRRMALSGTEEELARERRRDERLGLLRIMRLLEGRRQELLAALRSDHLAAARDACASLARDGAAFYEGTRADVAGT